MLPSDCNNHSLMSCLEFHKIHLSYINGVSSQEIVRERLVCLKHDDIQFYFLKLHFRLMKIQKQIGIAYVLHNKIFIAKRKTRNWLDFLVTYIYINNQTALFSIVSGGQMYKHKLFVSKIVIVVILNACHSFIQKWDEIWLGQSKMLIYKI